MKYILSLFVLFFGLVFGQVHALPEGPVVQMDIQVIGSGNNIVDQGRVLIALDAKNAPRTTRNFLNYVQSHFYDGTIFHRMIADFMIQGGGLTSNMVEKDTDAPIQNEASAASPNHKGTIAMARTMAVNSATSQFFINLKDNVFLDHRDESNQGYGYAVFGEVIDGMTWLESLQSMPTTSVRGYQDVPEKQIKIQHVFILSQEQRQALPNS